MRIVGVIAEYTPFHLGHAHHLQQARERYGADAVVVVMSSVFTQRGDAAILSPLSRARMALSCGADAVFALPAAWAVRDSEHFALGGVSLLKGLGCDAISFGTESANLQALQTAASLLEHPNEAFRAAVQCRMSQGLPYPAALSNAMGDLHPDCSKLLESPNSTLAVCYLRAMLRLNIHMEVVPVPRIGSYHNTALTGVLPSATALRGAILRGDWGSVRSAMPEEAYAILREEAKLGRIHRPEALATALLYRLRTMTDADYSVLPDVSEGIEYRLQAAASAECTRNDVLLAAKARRYPYARLSRLATHALLGLTDKTLPDSTPDAAMLLGFRREARGLFTHFKERGTLPIWGKAADFDRQSAWFQTEMRACDLWALGAGLPGGLAVPQGIAVE